MHISVFYYWEQVSDVAHGPLLLITDHNNFLLLSLTATSECEAYGLCKQFIWIILVIRRGTCVLEINHVKTFMWRTTQLTADVITQPSITNMQTVDARIWYYRVYLYLVISENYFCVCTTCTWRQIHVLSYLQFNWTDISVHLSCLRVSVSGLSMLGVRTFCGSSCFNCQDMQVLINYKHDFLALF